MNEETGTMSSLDGGLITETFDYDAGRKSRCTWQVVATI
jgi:hypothetical protein